MIYTKDSHCNYCGSKFSELSWPRKCEHCLSESYKNPIPVVVTLLEVIDNVYNKGLLIQRRNIDPKKGEWALSGGYLEYGESWRAGAARELKEELGVSILEKDIILFDVKDAINGNILIFNIASINNKYIDFKPNHEVSEIDIIYKPQILAFPSHTECVQDYFYKKLFNNGV